MIIELLSVVAPVFIVALVGLAWARCGAHFDEVSISRLVLNVGVPCGGIEGRRPASPV